ncbi:MAG: FtsW/RodA/SpoVE family cell cycle protein, partial [Agathobacter sp.]
SVIDSGGYQITQSMFAIGTGGWTGMGLFQGMPEKIPVRESDFVFSAISEEMGGIFALCIILVCFSCYIMTLNIAMQIKDMFYKLIALGLGTVYGVQVFLCIGGVIKFIPSTGVTLPFVSSGGSSLLCTIIMFAIIQGLYILRQDEGAADERAKIIEKDTGKVTKKVTGNDTKKVAQNDAKKVNRKEDRHHRPQSGKDAGRRSGFDNDIEELW